jgi:hypothetical protein
MFKAWMNTSNVGRTASRPFCGWDVEAIGRCEESAWDAGCEKEAESLSRTKSGYDRGLGKK